MASWRDELRTPQQKEFYIREYLDIHGPKSSRAYRSAARALQLYVSEGRNPKKAEFQAVREAAQFAADEKEGKKPPVGGDVIEPKDGYVREGDSVYAEMKFMISNETVVRRGTVEVSEDSEGLPAEAAWINEYWGEDNYSGPSPIWLETYACYKL